MNEEIREKAYKDFLAGMKYKDIAEKYDVSLSTVKSWAARHWKVATKGKRLQPKTRKVATKKIPNKVKEKLLESVNENEELTDERRLFCLYYAISRNAFQSYLKVYQCDKPTAMTNGPRLLRFAQVQQEVARLRKIMRQTIDLKVVDLMQYCLKIIGADIGDYVSFKGSRVTLTDSEKVDTSIISEVKQGKAGVSIRLADKKWAWEKLETYLGWQADAGNDVDMQNYVDALKGHVNEVWADEKTETTGGDV